jgi:electron transport complex protein RnfD
MLNQKKFIVSHAPFWHNGSGITERSYHTMLAALPALLMGFYQYGMPAVGVISLSVSAAMLWELAFNKAAKLPVTVGDGNAAVVGLVLAMLLPATAPWWIVIMGTFLAVVVGKNIFGGIGSNPFNPVAVAVAMMMLSWGGCFDFNQSLVNYELNFPSMVYPLTAVKNFGVSAADAFTVSDLIWGKQIGGIGAGFGLGLIVGGIYLMLRGFIRWEISLSFIAGIILTALLFNTSDPSRYGSPMLHLFSGYTLVAVFFLAPEDSSSPVNFIPMLLYGLTAGVMTVLIRNIGAYADGVIFAILVANLLNPLLDKIRPKTLGHIGKA